MAILTKRNLFIRRKTLFIVLGVIIALEVAWAGWTLFKGTSPTPQVSRQEVFVTGPKSTEVTLTSDRTSLKVGEKANVSINLSSSSQTDGVDLIIIYDPKFLSAKPVILGKVYSDYPQNVLDDKAGRIIVSGITSQVGGVLANGLFGSVEFTAKAAGVAKISLDFTPGTTGDSNITESGTGKDVLEKVNSLELNIQ